MDLVAHHPFKSEKAKQRYLARYDERATRWPVPSTTRMVETSFGSTFVRASGPEGAPGLFLLPGIGSPCHTFTSNVKALSGQFRTFAIDNIHDNGRSIESRPVRNADDFTTWLDEVRAGLALEKVSLVGLSYGGWISVQYALRFPARVERLVLLAPAGTVAPIPWGFIWRAILCVIPARALMRSFMAWTATDVSVDPADQARLDEMTDDAYLAHHSFRTRRMVPPLPLSDEQWNRLTVPTLLLAGDREVIFPVPEAVALLARVAPRVKVDILPGVGHLFFVTRADEVNRRIVEFLAPSLATALGA